MIILNIIGVLILYVIWKMEKEANGGVRNMDTVSAFLIPCLMAVSICWIIFDILLKV
jgi:hypothetical protein